MNKKIIGVNSDTDFAYENVLVLNRIVRTHEISNEIDLFILDLMNFENAKLQMLQLVNGTVTKPILWIVEPNEASRALESLKDLPILGRVQIEYRLKDETQAIVQQVAMLLAPDMATKRFSMDLFIPVFNEAHRAKYLREFTEKLGQLHNLGFPYMTIYFIDDGSTDDSDKFIHEITELYESQRDSVGFKAAFKLVQLGENTHKAGTYIEAFRRCTADVIIFVDADNAFHLEDITKLINIIDEGYYDIVIGTKDKTAEDRPFIRDIISTIKRLMTRPLLPKGVTDSQTGLKIFRGSVVKHILPHLNNSYGLAIDLKIIHTAGKLKLRVLEVPVYFKDREGSHIRVMIDSVKFVGSLFKIALGM